ncbi:hypothetical protein [Spiroplasma endosymbiont of Nebria brevicollis]|uniref:hypothetical protein n=1 Tax=Spiroplasma endosymbiont of Nebria brevicollis TaxID=3066284 RepID=UPI00313B0095
MIGCVRFFYTQVSFDERELDVWEGLTGTLLQLVLIDSSNGCCEFCCLLINAPSLFVFSLLSFGYINLYNSVFSLFPCHPYWAPLIPKITGPATTTPTEPQMPPAIALPVFLTNFFCFSFSALTFLRSF